MSDLTNDMVSAQSPQQVLSEEIPDLVIAELQSLDEVNMSRELPNVVDILKDLMEVDDEFLDSLAKQVDTYLDASNQNANYEMLGVENPQDTTTQLELIETTQQDSGESMIQINADNVCYFGLESELIPQTQISQPIDPNVAKETSAESPQTFPKLQPQHELEGLTRIFEDRETGNNQPNAMSVRQGGKMKNRSLHSQLYKQRITKSLMNNRRHKSIKSSSEPIETFQSEGEKVHKCKLCTKTFRQKFQLSYHLLIHTHQQAPYSCEFCDKTFSYKCRLVSHSIVHTDEMPYQCGLCKKLFRSKYNLAKHRHCHDEKAYSCEVCKAPFQHKNSLIAHSYQHNGKWPHKCQVCEKTFPYKHRLLQHSNLHTGERPYHCDKCSKTYLSNQSLRDHKRKKHHTESVATKRRRRSSS